jgi:hypothetical protein
VDAGNVGGELDDRRGAGTDVGVQVVGVDVDLVGGVAGDLEADGLVEGHDLPAFASADLATGDVHGDGGDGAGGVGRGIG